MPEYEEGCRNLLLAMGVRVADNGVFYVYTVFSLTYATQPGIGFSRSSVLNAVSIAAVFQLFALPTFGWLSDRLGRRPVYLFGAIFTALFAFPFFWLIETSNPGLLVMAIVFSCNHRASSLFCLTSHPLRKPARHLHPSSFILFYDIS